MKPIRVLLVEDHLVVREGFRSLLVADPDFEVVGEESDGRAAVAATRRLRPDVILMDIAMEVLNGIEATRQIVADDPSARVVMLSAHGEDAYLEHAFAAGAIGFVLKHASVEGLCDSIRSIMSGEPCSDATCVTRASRSARDRTGVDNDRLTTREREVLQMIAEGNANKQIGVHLNISIKTVEKHRAHLMEKLDIHDIAGLTRHAIATGMVESTLRMTILESRGRGSDSSVQ